VHSTVNSWLLNAPFFIPTASRKRIPPLTQGGSSVSYEETNCTTSVTHRTTIFHTEHTSLLARDIPKNKNAKIRWSISNITTNPKPTKHSGMMNALNKATKRTKRFNQQSTTGDHHGCYHN